MKTRYPAIYVNQLAKQIIDYHDLNNSQK